MKRILSFCLVLLFIINLTACSNGNAETEVLKEQVTQLNNEIEIFKEQVTQLNIEIEFLKEQVVQLNIQIENSGEQILQLQEQEQDTPILNNIQSKPTINIGEGDLLVDYLLNGAPSGVTGFFLQAGVWGDARDVDIKAVLQSVLDVYSDTYGEEYISRHNKYTIIISGSPPRTYEGLFGIQINANDTYWAFYMYEFGHELYHYTDGIYSGENRHQWFEEMLANMHSLYILDTLAEKWKANPPYINWIDYVSAIKLVYEVYSEVESIGLFGQELADFCKENISSWEQDPYDDKQRRYNTLSPILYNEIFKDNPNAWGALKTLHNIGACEELTFEQYLKKWHDECDNKEKEIVEKIAQIFYIDL